MLNGGAILRVSADVRGKDLEMVWTHLVYELEKSTARMEMWEMSTGVMMFEIAYAVQARTEAKYNELLLEKKRDFLSRLCLMLEQKVGIVDFLAFSPIPPGRRRVGLMRPRKNN